LPVWQTDDLEYRVRVILRHLLLRKPFLKSIRGPSERCSLVLVRNYSLAEASANVSEAR